MPVTTKRPPNILPQSHSATLTDVATLRPALGRYQVQTSARRQVCTVWFQRPQTTFAPTSATAIRPRLQRLVPPYKSRWSSCLSWHQMSVEPLCCWQVGTSQFNFTRSRTNFLYSVLVTSVEEEYKLQAGKVRFSRQYSYKSSGPWSYLPGRLHGVTFQKTASSGKVQIMKDIPTYIHTRLAYRVIQNCS